MNCIAIIPAKGTSRRIPRKNLALCAGKTLLQRAIECAQASGIFQRIIVSTEDLEIATAVPPTIQIHHRPEDLSADGVGVAAVVTDVLSVLYWEGGFRPDAFCVLWPTSPLRTPEMLARMWHSFTTKRMQPSATGMIHHPQAIQSLHSVCWSRPGQMGGHWIHEGTAIFMSTAAFLRRLSLDFREDDPWHEVPDVSVCDVNTADDLAEAERRLLARETACHPSS